MTTYVHPLNQHTVHVRAPRFWTLLFGPLYFASHGAWKHVFISLAVGVCTAGLSWLVYPFFAATAIRTSYLERGFRLAS